MEFTELRKVFIETYVINGYSSVKEIPEEKYIGIPKRLVERWVRQLTEAPGLEAIPYNPRLINRFTIGADPEFSLFEIGGRQFPAQKLGLQTGLAFGMDMNGRLVELRPTPSRFALDVVASILAELRWLAMYYPSSLQYQWVSQPFDGQDGVGGHVHFARQREHKRRLQDIYGLSSIYSILLTTGVFSKGMNDYRLSNTKYGQKSDFRLQRYGYEYRAFPTWMDSPWLAYLVLVLSKLTFFQPNLIIDIAQYGEKSPKLLERAIRNLLAAYKSIDDDAWIAWTALKKHGLPQQNGADFRGNWGILYPKSEVVSGDYYPPMIEGTENEREAIFNYLIDKANIKPDVPTRNWEPKVLPPGYTWMMDKIKTYHKVGIGEICNGLVSCNKFPVQIDTIDNKNLLKVYYGDYSCMDGVQKLKEITPSTIVDGYPGQGRMLSILIPIDLRTVDTIPKVKAILTSGAFPLWDVKDVKPESWDVWVKLNKVQGQKKLIGKELVI